MRLGVVLTPGQTHDVQGFGVLFRMIDEHVQMLLADRGYDADAIRSDIALTGTKAVIPGKKGR
ncbi:transposase [Endosaccharibacter trunci]|uniref:transposase n=1 Tax=Endosaccharibacter trunci TaxID=2812733 RepID=UPI003BF5418F